MQKFGFSQCLFFPSYTWLFWFSMASKSCHYFLFVTMSCCIKTLNFLFIVCLHKRPSYLLHETRKYVDFYPTQRSIHGLKVWVHHAPNDIMNAKWSPCLLQLDLQCHMLAMMKTHARKLFEQIIQFWAKTMFCSLCLCLNPCS